MSARQKKKARTASNLRTRKAKADFIRWARAHPRHAWTVGKSVCWVSDAMPSQKTGHTTSYVFSRAVQDKEGSSYQEMHETGIVNHQIAPIHRAQFWRYLHRHCTFVGGAA